MLARSGLRNRALVIALLGSLLLWHLPFGGLVLYPFKLFATWLHELSHGMIMLTSGAGFDRMAIYDDTSGFAYSVRHPGAFAAALIASAGYMGTALFGAYLLVVAKTPNRAKVALGGIGVALALTAVFFVRNRFGVVVVLVGAGAFLAVAGLAADRIATFLLNFVAAQACINAVLDIRVLFSSNLVVNGVAKQDSDAHNMAAATFGTPWMWATIWLLWSFGLFYWALRRTAAQERAMDAAAYASSRSPQGSASM